MRLYTEEDVWDEAFCKGWVLGAFSMLAVLGIGVAMWGWLA